MKIFNVAVIMTIVATVTVSNGAFVPLSALDVAAMEEIPTIESRCPPTLTADFDVIFYGENASMVKGCATLEFRSHHDPNEMKMFMWFGYLNSSACVTADYENEEQLVFSCTSQSATPPPNKGEVYKLMTHALKQAGQLQTKCVLYKMTNSVINMIAISGTTSCEGLSQMMFYSKATPSKGSMLLRLSKPTNKIRYVRSTSEDKNSTKLEQDFTGSIYTWMLG